MRSEYAANLALDVAATQRHRQLINVKHIPRSYPRPLWSRILAWVC